MGRAAGTSTAGVGASGEAANRATYMRDYWRRRRATDQQADPSGRVLPWHRQPVTGRGGMPPATGGQRGGSANTPTSRWPIRGGNVSGARRRGSTAGFATLAAEWLARWSSAGVAGTATWADIVPEMVASNGVRRFQPPPSHGTPASQHREAIAPLTRLACRRVAAWHGGRPTPLELPILVFDVRSCIEHGEPLRRRHRREHFWRMHFALSCFSSSALLGVPSDEHPLADSSKPATRRARLVGVTCARSPPHVRQLVFTRPDSTRSP